MKKKWVVVKMSDGKNLIGNVIPSWINLHLLDSLRKFGLPDEKFVCFFTFSFLSAPANLGLISIYFLTVPPNRSDFYDFDESIFQFFISNSSFQFEDIHILRLLALIRTQNVLNTRLFYSSQTRAAFDI